SPAGPSSTISATASASPSSSANARPPGRKRPPGPSPVGQVFNLPPEHGQVEKPAPLFMQWLESLSQPLRKLFAAKPLRRRGEDAAASFLVGLGYTIVARGHRDNIGEIDLVAVDGRTVVFVEVKTRTTHDAGHPADAVDDVKQRRLTRLALSYMKRHDLLECAARFDVVAVTWPNNSGR